MRTRRHSALAPPVVLADWEETFAYELAMLGDETTERCRTLRGTIQNTVRTHGIKSGAELGDVYDMVDDVAALTAVTAWEKRATMRDHSTSDARHAWVYTIAKNLARQAVAKEIASSRKVAAAGAQVRTVEATHASDGHPHMNVLERIKAVVMATPGVGSAGWDRVMAKAHRSSKMKRAITDAVHKVAAGHPFHIASITSHVLHWEDWARERLRRGHSLSTTEAVAHGAFTSPTVASRTLLAWWVKHRPHGAGPVCANQIQSMGLVDHAASDAVGRWNAAANALTGLAYTANVPLDPNCLPVTDCGHQSPGQSSGPVPKVEVAV
jgi:hypothetical protein